MTRQCIRCSADLSGRHYHTTTCFACARKWSVFTGAASAYAKVSAAIKKGLLPHASACTCVDCGKPARDYDHRDYSQPLVVVPVCRSCNKLRGPAIHKSA